MTNEFSLFSSNSVQFVMLSFEGPDLFSLAGGLGIRAKEMCECLSSLGYDTHLYFVGDPELPSSETNGKLTLHRWCQWLSKLNPGGCYMGEADKIADLNASWPQAVIDDLVAPAAKKGVVTVFLIEEWQTAAAAIALGRKLEETGLSRHALILWNANNLYGFERITWEELNKYTVITTVSRYMKHRMWIWGVNPVVIHNGIPKRLLQKVPQADVNKLRDIFPGLLVTKVGRYDVDKRWVMAVAAVGDMKRRGMHPKMICRGGNEHHRWEVRAEAERQGLTWSEIRLPAKSPKEVIFAELVKHREADVLEMCFYVPEDFINIMYAGSDCVLANSGHEPFGLVGLEVMACGGLPFVGATGEDYAQTLVNCAMVETEDPREIVEYVKTITTDDELDRELREEARLTSARYIWERIAVDLFQKIRFLAVAKGVHV